MMTEYEKFSEWVNQCDSEEPLQKYRKDNAATALRGEFWKQRRIALNAETALEKQQALTKLHWIQQQFGCRIPIQRSISQFTAPEGLYGIFISAKAAVGTGCVIFQNVTIGSNTLSDDPNAGFPVIGDYVHIGAGAVILGNVVVGDHARIGPNCCVTEDIPANSVVSPAGLCVRRQTEAPDNQHLSPEQFMKDRFDGIVYDYEQNPEDPELSVEKAAPADVDAVMQLYRERSTWFKWKKIGQWSQYLKHHPRDEFLRKIEAGEYFLVKKGPEVIGGFCLSLDSENWMDETTDAYYLCRAVSKVGYKNIGAYIAAEAKKQTRAAGKQALRLECVHTNKQLNANWERLGFAFVRDGESTYHYALREWKVADSDPVQETDRKES